MNLLYDVFSELQEQEKTHGREAPCVFVLEIDDILRRLFTGLDGQNVHHRPLALISQMLFHRHTGGDFHPVTVLVVLQSHALGYKAKELHIIFTADHSETAGAVRAGIFLGVAHQQLHMDFLAGPTVGVIHHIHIPDTEILVGNVDQCLLQIEGAYVAVVVILTAGLILQVDVGAAIDHAKIALA